MPPEGGKVEGATTGSDTSGDFDISRFQQLLDKLEASKKRQQRQRSVEGRRDIFAQGLAGMMSNF
jgi:hypothetical protein|tara:strand:+ start:932 stop:1126 length:195 start_codon:yes stop_codon:yes gene_type:complete